MLGPIVAALIASATSSPNTLAGMTLGTPLGSVAIAHPDARRYPRTNGWLWTWKRPEGGTLAVYTDSDGVIKSIDFTADEGENGAVDLPCAGKFLIQGSHVNLEFAIDAKVCVPGNMGTYELPDHSILDVDFDGPGDGQLHEAVWYRPSATRPSE